MEASFPKGSSKKKEEKEQCWPVEKGSKSLCRPQNEGLGCVGTVLWVMELAQRCFSSLCWTGKEPCSPPGGGQWPSPGGTAPGALACTTVLGSWRLGWPLLLMQHAFDDSFSGSFTRTCGVTSPFFLARGFFEAHQAGQYRHRLAKTLQVSHPFLHPSAFLSRVLRGPGHLTARRHGGTTAGTAQP